MDTNFEDVLNACIERIAAGESPDDVLRAFPDHAPQLEPLLDAARPLTALPAIEPAPRARANAQQHMLAALDTARSAHRASGLFASLWKQPAFRAAAVAGGIALFGAAGVGATAATGSAPAPVREFFGFHDDDPTATPTIADTATPGSSATPDDHEDNDADDDHSGPGGGDADDDHSGPGGDDADDNNTPETDDGDEHEDETKTPEVDDDHEDSTKTAEPDDDHEDATKTSEPNDDEEDETKTPEPDDDHADDGHEDGTPEA